MHHKELHLINHSLEPLLELGEYLANKENAFDLLSALIEQFEKSIYSQFVTHSFRVSILAELLGDAINLSKGEQDKLRKSALLHDIGKLFLPHSIFLKKERLSTREWQMVQLHPELGVTLVNMIPELEHLGSGILAHHEKFNGTGYPYGLKEQQIPLFGRIIGMVDNFDALTSPRPYHKPLSIRQTLAKMSIQMEQGLWDPFLFERFKLLISEVAQLEENNKLEFTLFKN